MELIFRMIWSGDSSNDKIEAFFTFAADAVGKRRGHAALAAARRTANQDTRAAIVALAAEHCVQSCNTGRNPCGTDRISQA